MGEERERENEGTGHCLDWQNLFQAECFPLACSSSKNNGINPFLPSLLPPFTPSSPFSSRNGPTEHLYGIHSPQLLTQVQGMGWEEEWWCHLLHTLAGHRTSVAFFLSTGAEWVSEGFLWAGGQEVPLLLCVPKLVPSMAVQVLQTHCQGNLGMVHHRFPAQLWNLCVSSHLPQGRTVGSSTDSSTTFVKSNQDPPQRTLYYTKC